MSVGGVDFQIDTTTGALLVNMSGVTVEADIIDIDIAALIAGIANGKTLADLDTTLTSLDGKDYATQTSLALVATEVTAAAILAKLSADPASETTLAAAAASLVAIDNLLQTQEVRQTEIVKEHTLAGRTPYSWGVIIEDAEISESDWSSSHAGSSYPPDGPGVLPQLLSEESIRYQQATIQAKKPGIERGSSISPAGPAGSSAAGSSSSSSGSPVPGPTYWDFIGNALPTANTGNVYVFAKTEPLDFAIELTPGEKFDLPPNCDLNDFGVAALNDCDGVVVLYTGDPPPRGSSSPVSSSSSSSSS